MEKRPNIIYFHDCDFNMQKHKLDKDCCPQVIYTWGDVTVDGYHIKETYWRCSCARGDFHGHASLAAARDYLRNNIQSYIYKLTEKLKNLK